MDKLNAEDAVHGNDIESEPCAEAPQQNGSTESTDTTNPTTDDANETENCNPERMPEELKDIFLVDAIGDTLYSKRFVLKTLVNLNKVENKLSEEFEKDLCTLWDMTVEKDVIRLLLQHSVLDVFSDLIKMSEDQRLVEILLGIIGNMCSLSETREALCQQPEVMIPIIDLISCSDSLILVQLMRLFHTCLVFENSGDEYIWFQHFRCADQFVDKFAFLLSNSMSTSLLLHAYEALNAICTKFAVIEIQPEIADSSGFRDVFVKQCLAAGVIEAFKQMLPDMPRIPDAHGLAHTNAGGDVSRNGIDDDIAAPTKRTQRIMSLFLDINVILSQYDRYSQRCYEPLLPQLMECVQKCLQPLCQPMYLLPLSSNEQIIIENVNELIQALDDPFEGRCFQQMIKIWMLIDQHLARLAQKKTRSEWDAAEDDADDDDEEEVSGIDVNMTILEYITRTSKNATQDQVERNVRELNQDTVMALCKALSPGSSEPDILACIVKFRAATKVIWDIDIPISDDEFEARSVSDVDEDNDFDEDDIDACNGSSAVAISAVADVADSKVDVARTNENQIGIDTEANTSSTVQQTNDTQTTASNTDSTRTE